MPGIGLVECDYLGRPVIMCDEHNAVCCGRNERDCDRNGTCKDMKSDS
jgi:hypothetical protein